MVKQRTALLMAGAATVVGGVVVAGIAMAATDQTLPHEPNALQAQMVSEVGSRFAVFGAPTFFPLDEDLSQINTARSRNSEGEADSAYLLFGQEKNTLKVFVGPATDATGLSADDICSTGPHAVALTCSAEPLESGGVVVTTVYAFVRSVDLGGQRTIIEAGAVRDAGLDSLEFERNVRFLDSTGAMTSVTESVPMPTSTDPESHFQASLADMEAVATDPGLAWQ